MIKNQKTPTAPTKKAAPPKAEPTAEGVPTTFSAKDLAKRCEVDAKVFRAWLRRHLADHEKGARYEFDALAADDLVAAFKAKAKVTDDADA